MDWAKTWAPSAVGLLCFTVFAFVLPPSHYWLDSGELSAAAIGLGVPHETGFPLYLLAAKLMSLVPVGELGFRVALLSALCAGLTAGVVVRLLMEVHDDESGVVVAVVSALAVAATTVFFRQATVAEVYAPTALVAALTLLLVRRVGQGAPARVGIVLALVFALGCGLHLNYRLLLGVPVAVVLIVRLRHGAKWPLYTPALVVLVCSALYAYLPLRSGQAPALDWGHPSTLVSALSYMSGGQIRASFSDQLMTGNLEVLISNAGRFLELSSDSLGVPLLLAALAGVVALGRQASQRMWLATLAFVALGDFVIAVWINPMGIQDLQNGTLMILSVCLLAGAGLHWLCLSVGRAGPYVGAVAGTIVVGTALLPTLDLARASRGSQGPQLWSHAVLSQAGPRAVVFSVNDSSAAGLLYASTVEGARPDATFYVQQLMADRQTSSELWKRSGREGDFSSVEQTISVGPVLWEPSEFAPPAGFSVPDAPFFRVERTPEGPGGVRTAASKLRALLGGEIDNSGRRVLAHALAQLSVEPLRRWLRTQGRDQVALDDARALLEAAIAVDPRSVKAWVNLGVAARAAEELTVAIRAAETASRLDLTHLGARLNAARYRLENGDRELALRHVDRALRLAPDSSRAHGVRATVLLALDRLEEAREAAQRAMELEPGNAEARATLNSLGTP